VAVQEWLAIGEWTPLLVEISWAESALNFRLRARTLVDGQLEPDGPLFIT
jgi:hypothetical protein